MCIFIYIRNTYNFKQVPLKGLAFGNFTFPIVFLGINIPT